MPIVSKASKFPQFSKVTIIIALFIIISASFMRQVMDFVKATIGERGFVFLIGIIGVIFLVVFLILIIKKRPNFLKISICTIVLIAGMWMVWQLKIPEEKIHILEFAVLGWFASRDLIKADKKGKGIVFALAFTFTVGVLDEAFQAILPYRFFDLRDIAFNGMGGIYGIILYLLN